MGKSPFEKESYNVLTSKDEGEVDFAMFNEEGYAWRHSHGDSW